MLHKPSAHVHATDLEIKTIMPYWILLNFGQESVSLKKIKYINWRVILNPMQGNEIEILVLSCAWLEKDVTCLSSFTSSRQT